MCQCRFVDGNKYTYLVEDVDNVAVHVWGQRVYGRPLYFAFNFAVNVKML